VAFDVAESIEGETMTARELFKSRRFRFLETVAAELVDHGFQVTDAWPRPGLRWGPWVLRCRGYSTRPRQPWGLLVRLVRPLPGARNSYSLHREWYVSPTDLDSERLAVVIADELLRVTASPSEPIGVTYGWPHDMRPESTFRCAWLRAAPERRP
jgi:hypothetical protein